ncbi:MAG TPA: hypothetical protein VIK90_03070 [Limnochordales bacterium]
MAVAAPGQRPRQAARRLRSSRKAWTPAEKEQARRIVADCQARGLPLSEAFRQVAEALPQRSPTAVAMLYYNVLRREGADGRPPAAAPASAPASAAALTVRPELVEAFEGLPEYIARLHHRLDQVEARLADLPQPTPAALAAWARATAAALESAAGTQARLQEAQARQAALARANDELSRRLADAERRLEEVLQAYREARELYEAFAGMASISQLMSLGDFKQRMRAALERWGALLEGSARPDAPCGEAEPLPPTPAAAAGSGPDAGA